MKFIVALLLIVVVAHAAKHVRHATSPFAITGSYIVVLKQSTAALRDSHIEELQAIMTATNDFSEVTYRYDIDGQFVGFAGKLSDNILQIELAHEDVDYIEADQVVRAVDYASQTGATWGLARISKQATWHPDTDKTYNYDTTAGSGVDVYVIDTGIYVENVDFEGRARPGYNAYPTEGNSDPNGHGTHCAGTIGGKTYGVAKKVNLIGVKVLSRTGSGSTSGVVAGVNNVTGEFKLYGRPTVASMSLGGGASTTLDNAVKASVGAGVAYSIAAGNSAADACNSSPARVSKDSAAITVGATDKNDNQASYSNYGSCVSIYAPGTSITSDWIGSPSATNIISGTSMACPHVSGVLALKLGKDGKQTPAALKAWINKVATPNIPVDKHKSTQKTYLLFSPYQNL